MKCFPLQKPFPPSINFQVQKCYQLLMIYNYLYKLIQKKGRNFILFLLFQIDFFCHLTSFRKLFISETCIDFFLILINFSRQNCSVPTFFIEMKICQCLKSIPLIYESKSPLFTNDFASFLIHLNEFLFLVSLLLKIF